MSKPILGMIIGMVVGVAVGVLGTQYFNITLLLDRVCLVASSVLIFQLFGATITAALGKPHRLDE